MNGCKAVNASRAFINTDIPSENLSASSFTALAISVSSAAARVASKMGMNGAALV